MISASAWPSAFDDSGATILTRLLPAAASPRANDVTARIMLPDLSGTVGQLAMFVCPLLFCHFSQQPAKCMAKSHAKKEKVEKRKEKERKKQVWVSPICLPLRRPC
jgi:hypothetical protein